VLYSEIFQMTGPVKRTACILAGHGFVVAVPEVYHELLPAGTVLTYTPEDSARGNACKVEKELASYDADAAAAVAFLAAHPACSGAVGVAGMCLGGGLAFRAAVTVPAVKAAVCWCASPVAAPRTGCPPRRRAATRPLTPPNLADPTDLHKAALSASGDDSLARCGDAKATPLLLLFGTADPHIPAAGRRQIQDALAAAGSRFEWHEFAGAHAFLRDENSFGRYDPVLAAQTYTMAVEFLQRWLR